MEDDNASSIQLQIQDSDSDGENYYESEARPINDDYDLNDPIPDEPLDDVNSCHVYIPAATNDTDANHPAISYEFADDDNELDPAMQYSLKLHTLAMNHSISREYRKEQVKVFNEYAALNGIEKLKSPYMVEEEITARYAIKPMIYDCCINGCKMYNENDNGDSCPFCDEKRYNARAKRSMDGSNMKRTSRATATHIPLSAQIARLIAADCTREKLLYRSQRQEKAPGEYDDVFDGSIYKSVADTCFTRDLDIALALFTDGFRPFKSGTWCMTIVHFVILNFPPQERYEKKNMIQVCIVPGPRAPKDLFSFLSPTIAELERMQEGGLSATKGSNTFKARVHLLLVSGDIPAVAKMMNHRGHTFRFACRQCLTEGKRHKVT